MNKIKVKAAQGLRVPMADNPHQYIVQEVMEVDGDEVYYRRLIAEGDLIILPDKLPEPSPEKQPESKKGKANG